MSNLWFVCGVIAGVCAGLWLLVLIVVDQGVSVSLLSSLAVLCLVIVISRNLRG